MTQTTIRAVLPSHETAWRRLWPEYCASVGLRMSPGVADRTWTRILDPDSAVTCVVAESGGRLVGFAHCVVHETTRESQPVCYLEDLYVEPGARGAGVGHALLEWLRNAMRAEGWSRLYWVTHEDNAPARGLYQRFAQADDVVRYLIRSHQP